MDQAQYKKANQSNKKLVLFSFAGPTKKSCPKDTTVKMLLLFLKIYPTIIVSKD